MDIRNNRDGYENWKIIETVEGVAYLAYYTCIDNSFTLPCLKGNSICGGTK